MIIPCSVSIVFRAVQKLTVSARLDYKEDLIYRERSVIETPCISFFIAFFSRNASEYLIPFS